MAVDKKYVSVEELKKHNKPGDLWISIQGKIYNVTDWKNQHPGGDIPLLNLGGQDVTDAFIAFHPGSAWQYLDKLFTGYHLEGFEVSEVSKDYRRMASEFSKAGMFEKKEHVVIYSLCFVTLLFAAAISGVLCSENFWVHMAAGGLLGFAWVQVTYLGHDSGHYNIMTSRGFNNLAQILTGNCLTGISIAWWKWTHNAHHIAVNSLDYDPDLQHLPFFAVSSTLHVLSGDVRRENQSLFADILVVVLESESAQSSHEHFRNPHVLDLVSSPRFVLTQLDRAGFIRVRELLRHLDPAHPVLSEPFRGERLRRTPHGERLVRETDARDDRHIVLDVDGLVPRRASVSAGAPPVPAAAAVPPPDDLAPCEGTLQETQLTVPELVVLRSECDDDQDAQGRRHAGSEFDLGSR
ncbi:stearoyl-CoA 9-desaturase [Sarracenia purpurea var. burkii]